MKNGKSSAGQSGLQTVRTQRRTRRRYETVLPEITDAVPSALSLLSARLHPEEVDVFVLDFTNAITDSKMPSLEKASRPGMADDLYHHHDVSCLRLQARSRHSSSRTTSHVDRWTQSQVSIRDLLVLTDEIESSNIVSARSCESTQGKRTALRVSWT